jgi:hypothetical protein
MGDIYKVVGDKIYFFEIFSSNFFGSLMIKMTSFEFKLLYLNLNEKVDQSNREMSL